MSVLAVDVGGTKIAVGLVDDDGAVLRSARAPTGADPWSVLAGLAAEMTAGVGVSAVGIGCGGPMDWRAGVVHPLNLPAWRDGFPLRQRLHELYPGVPVRLHNDAVCMAVGEHWVGAGRGVADLLGMVVSTGVGGGLVLGGRLVDGANGNAGHIGHVQVDPAGPWCACGRQGCLEAVARGPAVVAWARERGSTAGDGRQLAAEAAAGDPLAVAALARAGAAVGQAVASTAALLDLTLVTVGGGLSQAGPPFWDALHAAVREQARLGYLAGLRVVPAALGQEAGLVGAAALVLRGDLYWSGEAPTAGAVPDCSP